ncbi:MFS transporter [Dictyobacter kobayashii]|uniref:Major facilitator superfamily (MFS) profile domain-containing protein n=1 Tax=Dictyobacter kobayashii TaxID=2014872 RepID=A0A402AUW4_9CHLR|nr:MFS transporter [Dictyobacter kobayashii]GCE22865.1 hypothetical protein KDK_66650 [Dictyobacter kobayashii]
MSGTLIDTHTRIARLSFRLQVGLAFLIFILIGANDGAGGVLIPSMGIHYSINKSTVSLTFFFSTIGYLLASLNSGVLIRRLGTRRFLWLGAIIFMLSLFMLSLTPPFLLFACCLLPLGFGVSMLDIGLNAYVASLPRSTVLLNYLHAFYGCGALLGPLVASSFLALQLPWNGVYLVWAIFCLLILLGIIAIFKNQPASPQEHPEDVGKNLLWSILKLRLTWIFAFFLFCYVGLEIVVGTWIYSFLTEQRHVFTLYAGWMASGYWLGLAVGRLVLGSFAQRIGEKRAIQLCVIGVMIGLALVWLLPIDTMAAFGLFLTGFCLGPIFPTAIALTSQVVSSNRLATSIGFEVSMGCVGGAFLPWIAGNMAQFFGLWSILPYTIFLALCLLSLWLILQSWLHKDHALA